MTAHKDQTFMYKAQNVATILYISLDFVQLHDFPGLENSCFKFNNFPGSASTPCKVHMIHSLRYDKHLSHWWWVTQKPMRKKCSSIYITIDYLLSNYPRSASRHSPQLPPIVISIEILTSSINLTPLVNLQSFQTNKSKIITNSQTSTVGWGKQSFSLYPQLVSMPAVNKFSKTESANDVCSAEIHRTWKMH